MTLRFRRILYITCILIFLLVAPPLILYTTGWRYDFTYNRLVSTGSLVVKSDPAAAQIRLNNRLFKAETPTIINDILPGKINLEVSRPGFYPWQRTVNVAARLTTFADNIKLFRQSAPEPILPKPAAKYWWNRKQDKIAYLAPNGDLRLYNTLNQKDDLLLKGPLKNSAALAWSPLADKIIIDNLVLDANSREKTASLGASAGGRLTNWQWDPKVPDALYGLGADGLYRLPYLLKTARLVAAGNIISYLVEVERIITLERDSKGKTNYLSWRAAGDGAARNRLALPANKGDVIKATHSERVAVANADKKTLLIFDPTIADPADKNKTLALENIAQAIWTGDGSRLIYSTGQAIYQVSFPSQQTELITRYSQPIANIFLSDNWAYLFYVLDNSLRVLETNDLSSPQSLTLIPGQPKIIQPEWVDGQKLVTFIDEAGQLQSLDLSSGEGGTGFFSR